MNKYSKTPKHDLTGKRFNYLVVDKMAVTSKSTDKSWRAICRCDCGRIADVNTNYLMRGLRKTCGNKECQYHRQDYNNAGKNNVCFAGYEGIHGSKWSGIRAAAKRRGLAFEVTIKEAWELFERQNRKCALTDLDIGFGKTYTEGNTASLDRIDSSKGYILGNIQWVHKDVNKMKMDISMPRFLELCRLVVTNEQKTN